MAKKSSVDNLSKKRKKAVIFAETPRWVNQTFFDIHSNELPEELQPIKEEYIASYLKFIEKSDRYNKNKWRLNSYLKGWYDKDEYEHVNIDDDKELNSDPTYLRYKKAVDDSLNVRRESYNAAMKISDRFYTHPLTRNPINEVNRSDPTFTEEGNKLKSYYKKQGIDAEVFPMYVEDSTAIKDKLKTINPQDDVALFGHAGSKIGGLTLEWWNENISQSDPENCYLGSCSAESGGITEMLPDVKNLHHTVDQSWRGVNPRADNPIEAMYSVMGHDTISPNPIIDKDYKISNVQTFANGGNIMANLKNLKRCGGGRISRRKKALGGELEGEDGMIGIKDDKFISGYPVGTPLQEIYNIPSDYSEQATLMATQGTRDALNRARWANFQGHVTDYPEGRSVPSFRYTPGVLAKMKEKGITRDYIESWQPTNYPEEFGVGGDIFGGAASGALTGLAFGPAGAGIGAVVGGLAGWLGGKDEEDPEELAENYSVPTGLSKQFYQRAAMGGKLTKFKGNRHENGGIALGGLPVEVEGGETRTNDMIHSDRIKITPAMIKKYPILKKSDKGKTMADITKREHKKFEKRTWDELNDNAAEITMLPYEEISEMLSQPEEQIFEDGGDISASKARTILSHGTIRGKPITAKQRRFFGAKSKAADGFNLQTVGKYAPLLTSGADLVGSLISGPEEVDYGQVNVAPTKVNFASAEPGVKKVRRTFGNYESKLGRMNPNRYMARMGEFASREADAVTDVAGGVQAQNVQAANRANIMDSQNAMRANLFNKQIGIGEAEANAANRGAWKSRMSANLANIGTMYGQMSRDERLQESSDAGRDRYFDILEEQNRILGGYGEVAPEEEDIFTNVSPLSAEPFPYARGGSLTHRLRLRNYKTA